MTTYTCKCGKTFEGRGDSVTTGYRISRAEYTPDHDCFGCPFMKEATAEFVECRGTREIPIYGTTASCVSSKSSTLHVSSLDFDFIQAMQGYYNSLGVEDSKKPPLPGMENGSGRYQFSFDFPKNNKGEKAKRELIEHFFEPVQGEESYREMFARKDISGFAEEYSLYDKIEKAKEEAKSMAKGKQTEPATEEVLATKYQHGGRVYFVRPYQNGTYRAFFYFKADPTTYTVCSTISDGDTFEAAQAFLDDYAAKHDYEVYTPLESDLSSDDTPADAAGEPESADAGEQEQEEIPESDNDETPEEENQDDSANDIPDSDNNMPEAQNGSCDWKNASGADEDEEEPENDIPAGERVSLLDNAFSALIAACDEKINRALRTSVDAGQGFTFTAKVTFEPRGSVFGVKYETGYQFDPIKVKDKGELYEEIQIALDDAGNPIIPYDRQHQINFDELQPGRVIPPTPVTTTVDGNTGLVEDVQMDDEEPEDSPTSDDITNSVVGADLEENEGTEQQLPPCDHEDCPFYGVPDEGNGGCCFDSEDPDDSNFSGDLWTAVNMENCLRGTVLEAYRKNNPEDDYDGSDFPDDSNDLPFEMQENTEEDCAS